MHRILDTIEDVHDFTRFLATVKLPVTVEWVQGRDRTKDQNALMWLWASEVAAQYGDRHANDVQADWKLRHGVPILRDASSSFRADYDAMLKPLNYESKLKLMQMGFKVTSIMKVRQMVRFMDSVQQECIENGLILTEPDPELAKYQTRYRGMKDAE